MDKEKMYGFFGWKEFLRNRRDILDEYDKIKEKAESRPVRTEHGSAGEAAIRKWLSEYLPSKFGVTSGFIIPDIILDDYKLYHYDIIIYDNINSPVLWGQYDYDTSEQGKKRAIPAKFVYAIIEVKATFNSKNIADSMSKLSEIDPIKKHFPPNFITLSIFIELLNSEMKNKSLLAKLLKKPLPYKYYGGMIMRSEVNKDMTGFYKYYIPNNSEVKNKKDNTKILLVKDIDKIKIKADESGNPIIEEQYAGVVCFSDGKRWHYNKMYGPNLVKNDLGVNLNWSYNQFSRFAIELLCNLEGIDPNKQNVMFFGQVFDIIE